MLLRQPLRTIFLVFLACLDARHHEAAQQKVAKPALLGAAAMVALPPAITYGVPTDLGTLIGPSGSSAASAINAGGVIVGNSQFGSAGHFRAVTWIKGKITALPMLPGHTDSFALAVNSNGSAVGWSKDASGKQHAVRWDGTASVTDLLPGSNGEAAASGINDQGEIVGKVIGARRETRAVRFVNGTVVEVLPPASFGSASDISNRATGSNVVIGTSGSINPCCSFGFAQSSAGVEKLQAPDNSYNRTSGVSADGVVVAGQTKLNSVFHAAVWTGPAWAMQDLGTLGGQTSSAYGVNPAGTIVVGWSSRASGAGHAFYWQRESGLHSLPGFTSLQSCGSTANAINAGGTIVGTSCGGPNGTAHAALWTPQK